MAAAAAAAAPTMAILPCPTPSYAQSSPMHSSGSGCVELMLELSVVLLELGGITGLSVEFVLFWLEFVGGFVVFEELLELEEFVLLLGVSGVSGGVTGVSSSSSTGASTCSQIIGLA